MINNTGDDDFSYIKMKIEKKYYLWSNGALPVSFVPVTPLHVVGEATIVHQFVSTSLCGIFHNLELETETGQLLVCWRRLGY